MILYKHSKNLSIICLSEQFFFFFCKNYTSLAVLFPRESWGSCVKPLMGLPSLKYIERAKWLYA